MSPGKTAKLAVRMASANNHVPVSDFFKLTNKVKAIEAVVFPSDGVLFQVLGNEGDGEDELYLAEVSYAEEDLISEEEFAALAAHVDELTDLLSQAGQEIFIARA